MKIVCITGGIGSGKTTVANMFSSFGIPVYVADEESKKLLGTSKIIRKKLSVLLGEKAYVGNKPNKPFIADKIFNNPVLLSQMNAIVHPKVKQHFNKWFKKQNAPYIIRESAILFESGTDKDCNIILSVTASEDTRISRVLERDSTTEDKIRAIMKNQLGDEEKIKRSHYVIVNENIEETKQQVAEIHHKILLSGD